MSEQLNLTGVLEQIDDKAEGKKLTFGNMVEAFGDRGYGPLLLSVALIEMLPTGSIPGVPTVLAIAVVLIAGQLVLGRKAPWIPHWLANRGFNRSKFEKAREKLTPFTCRVDKIIKPRLQFLASALPARLVGAVCIVLAATMPPLEVIPMASTIPSGAIAILGLGLSVRDGLLVALGLIGAIGALFATYYFLFL